MKCTLLTIGKTAEEYLKRGISVYEKRLKRYNICYNSRFITEKKRQKTNKPEHIKLEEGKILLQNINTGDFVILLDERGKEFSSVKFAEHLRKKMIEGKKNVVFVIGGAFGFSEAMYQRANQKIALSKMTFSHQLVRLVFVEQLYRALTIIHNEPYHHQ